MVGEPPGCVKRVESADYPPQNTRASGRSALSEHWAARDARQPCEQNAYTMGIVVRESDEKGGHYHD